jgi:4-hydroxybenzoate polyprenyltransferase/phosphoserine phosphatase
MNALARTASGESAAAVLVVDMDGTLVRTDTLHEALLGLAAARPFAAADLCLRRRGDKAAFKRAVADLALADAGRLPLDEAVVDLVRAARAEGRRVVLVSAADHRQVEAVAARVGLFDEAFGTGSPEVAGNLSGAAKAAFLTARYGSGGFDYVGDARVDLPVWEAARRAVTVRAGPGLRRAVDRARPEAEHLPAAASGLAAAWPYLKALRPHQWSKNLLVFVPALAAHAVDRLPEALAAFVAFSLVASSVYLVNDLLDLAADRAHPRKRQRPFASGAIPLAHGVLLAPALVLAAIAIAALFTPPAFLGALALYYLVTFAYSLTLKRRLIVDVCTLAGLYTMRLVAGAAATSVALSPWLLAFSMFLFLALAAIKRQAELADQLKAGGTGASGRAYMIEDLPVMRGIALSAGYSAILVLALYISSDAVVGLYSRPDVLWAICPLLLYWVSRIVMITHRGWMDDDPIVYAARDRNSIVVAAIAGAIVLAAGPL